MSARRILAPPGHPARLTTTTSLDAAVDGRRRRAAPAARRRAGRPQRGRDLAAGVRLRRPGDDRGGRAGQGAAHRSGRARHRRARSGRPARTPGSSTSPTRSASSPGRCCRPGTGRSACATWPSASSAGSPALLAVAPERVGLDHVGLNHLTWERGRAAWTAWTCCRSCSPSTAARSPRRSSCPRPCCERLGVGAVVLPALLLRPRRGRPRAAAQAVAGRRGGGDRAASCSSCTPTRPLDEKPAELDAARRRVLLRGGGRARGVAGRAGARSGEDRARGQHRATTARCRSSDDDAVIEVPARVGTAGCRARCRSAPVEPLYRGADRPRRGLRAAGPRRRRCTAAGSGSSTPAGPPAGRADRPAPTG